MKKAIPYIFGFVFGYLLSAIFKVSVFDWEWWAVFAPVTTLAITWKKMDKEKS